MRKVYYQITKYIFMFLTASFIGWLYEIICDYCFYHEYSDRGVLHLPMCPIYGFGMFAILIAFNKLKNPFLIFISSTVITTVLELVVSYVLEWKWNTALWWYDDWPLNFEGRISAVSSCIFGLMALVFMKGIRPGTERIYSSRIKNPFSIFVMVLFTFCVVWELTHLKG